MEIKCLIRFLLLIAAEVAAISLWIRVGQLRAGLGFPDLLFLLLRPQPEFGSAPELLRAGFRRPDLRSQLLCPCLVPEQWSWRFVLLRTLWWAVLWLWQAVAPDICGLELCCSVHLVSMLGWLRGLRACWSKVKSLTNIWYLVVPTPRFSNGKNL